jgi:hypothetical protein
MHNEVIKRNLLSKKLNIWGTLVVVPLAINFLRRNSYYAQYCADINFSFLSSVTLQSTTIVVVTYVVCLPACLSLSVCL